MAAGHPPQPRAFAEAGRRARRAHRHRPYRRRGGDSWQRRHHRRRRPLGTERALRHPLAAAARRPHRRERLGRPRRRLADRERRRRRRVLGAHHPAHARGHDLGRAPDRRPSQSRSRSHGALRGAACRGEAGGLLTAPPMAIPRQNASDRAPLTGARVLVVEARFYDDIADELLRGARAALEASQATAEVVTVAGALEIPQMLAIALETAENAGRPYDAAVALGCVIRGDTFHFEIVAGESARALMDLSVARRIPLANGIITVDTEAQAWRRARVGELNKGGGAAEAALTVLRAARRLTAAG